MQPRQGKNQTEFVKLFSNVLNVNKMFPLSLWLFFLHFSLCQRNSGVQPSQKNVLEIQN